MKRHPVPIKSDEVALCITVEGNRTAHRTGPFDPCSQETFG